jgi:H/ACA ribonucleoprotein complex subunit 3|tara:strand:- start:1321 stop:1494 length:174 start_codon:yes stop_codon:yes gene_type:complete
MKHILKCQDCGEYTLKEKCKCGGKAVLAKPPKYSPEDKYGKYRRQVKKPELEKKGLI